MRQAPVRPRPAVSVNMPSHRLIVTAILVAALFFVCGCAKREQPKEQAPPTPTEAAPSPRISQLSPPQAGEVQEAVKRVFNEAALIDSSHNPNFIEGDFNGDDSQDIAIILKPALGKLSEMNEDAPAWILRNLSMPAQPGMASPHITPNEVLLAIIHGYGPDGWRDQQATQTYLLKNAVGSDLKVRSKREFLTENQDKKLPRLFGDLIGEVLQGRLGYLYFAQATYSWYDPKTFKGEAERRLIHPGAEARTEKFGLFNLRAKKEIAAKK